MDKSRGDYTCISGLRPSIIDYVLVDLRLDVESLNVEVLNIQLSDHLPIKLSLGLECRVNEYSSLQFRYTSPSRQLKREWSESEQNALSAIFSKEQVCRRLE